MVRKEINSGFEREVDWGGFVVMGFCDERVVQETLLLKAEMRRPEDAKGRALV